MSSNGATTMAVKPVAVVQIVLPLVAFLLAVCAIMRVHARSFAYQPPPSTDAEAAGADDPSPLRANERYMDLRASVLRISAWIWALCALMMASVWAVPWSAGMYLLCLLVSYWAWQAHDAARVAAMSPRLQQVCLATSSRLWWLRPIVFLHLPLTIYQLALLGPTLFERHACNVRNPTAQEVGLRACPGLSLYVQFAFGLLTCLVLVCLLVWITDFMYELSGMELAHEYFVAPPSAAAAVDANAVLPQLARRDDSTTPVVLQRHRQHMRQLKDDMRAYPYFLTVYFGKPARRALQREQMRVYLAGAEPDYYVPSSYMFVVKGYAQAPHHGMGDSVTIMELHNVLQAVPVSYQHAQLQTAEVHEYPVALPVVATATEVYAPKRHEFQ